MASIRKPHCQPVRTLRDSTTHQTDEWLCTKQVAALTGYSTSFFEKGRIYGYGPPYYKWRGKVLYRKSEVEAWLKSHRKDPEGAADE